jgi:hypothetical protein
MTLSTVIVTPRRNGVRASPAARMADVSMKNNNSDAQREVDPQERQGQRPHFRCRVSEVNSSGAAKYPIGPRTAYNRNRGQEGLLDGAIHLLDVAGADVTRHEHGLAGEERCHEDDDDEEDLPADADAALPV